MDSNKNESSSHNDHYTLYPDLSQVIKELRNAKRVAILTGAGISTESGIPTFRDGLDGFWSQFDPLELASPQGFAADPARVTRWYDERRAAIAKCQPNPGHIALAKLEQIVSPNKNLFTLVTQNIDRLHQLAGSKNVVELHGSIWEWRCTKTGKQKEYRGGPFEQYPPPSDNGGILRPSVVWFGEPLPPDAWRTAENACTICDVMLSIGTSAAVYPAAGLIDIAQSNGATTIEINPEQTQATPRIDLQLRGAAGVILPIVVDHLSRS